MPPIEPSSPTTENFHLWSAMPTPLLPDFEIDLESLARSVEWQNGLGIEGLFVAGTCGEGPFLRERQIDILTRSTVELSAGRMPVSVQVTDNSSGRILDRIARAKDNGANMATLAPPHFERFATPNTLAVSIGRFSIARLFLSASTISPSRPSCLWILFPNCMPTPISGW